MTHRCQTVSMALHARAERPPIRSLTKKAFIRRWHRQDVRVRKGVRPKVTIPAGLIRMSNGTKVRVYLDKRYVLGPEGAHVNIAGISGLANKTSYAMFLIQSILQIAGAKDIAADSAEREAERSVGHRQPRKGGETRGTRSVGVPRPKPQPFENVRYLLPWGTRRRQAFLTVSVSLPISSRPTPTRWKM
jgi:hypothetical protein